MSNPSGIIATVQPLPGCTLQAYAGAKRLPEVYLRSLGLKDSSCGGQPAVRIPYFGEDHSELAVRFRTALEKSAHADDRFRWKSGSKPVPYGLWRLAEARAKGCVVLVEGESDSQTLWLHDFPALGIPGAGLWKDRWADYLDSVEKIYIVIEQDTGGDSVRQWIGRSRIRDRVWLILAGPWKDASDLYVSDPGGFQAAWQTILDAAVPWQESARLQTERDRQKFGQDSSDLANEPDVLKRFEDAIRKHGVVGETRALKVIFLALTSRLLDRPISLALKAQPSTGKSHLVQSTLKFFPPSACFELTAMSERALAYLEEPLAHRIIVIYEAIGLSNEMAGYLVRSLLSEGRLKYVTVDKTASGMKSRCIDKEGPTGLIITTTAIKLRSDDETRLLSLPVTDTPEQTRQIMIALASETDAVEDFGPWHSFQEWLATSDNRVAIPFARKLAEIIRPAAPRLRRDFKLILNLIKSHAILHQCNREHDTDGRIIATLQDYEVIRGLTEDLVAESVDSSVRPTIRESVAAVKAELETGVEHAMVRSIAKRLRLHKSVAWRRVQSAIEAGYLRNEEERAHRPAKLLLGEPLPDDTRMLPTVEELNGCTVAANAEGVDTPLSQAAVIDDAGFDWSTGASSD